MAVDTHARSARETRWSALLGIDEGGDRRYLIYLICIALAGWLGAMFAGGLILGSGVWTALIASEGAVTLLIVAAGFAVLQLISVLFLPHIRPGRELEEVAT